MKTKIGLAAGIALALGASTLAGKSVTAETPAEFYKDTVITAILGAGPGGGYDLYARTVMSHLVKHIPGKPKYILQFMPGAGGIKAAAFVYNVAPKDGSRMAKLSNMLPSAIEPIFISILISLVLMVGISLMTYNPETATPRLKDLED